jgi:hypothetical protein
MNSEQFLTYAKGAFYTALTLLVVAFGIKMLTCSHGGGCHRECKSHHGGFHGSSKCGTHALDGNVEAFVFSDDEHVNVDVSLDTIQTESGQEIRAIVKTIVIEEDEE